MRSCLNGATTMPYTLEQDISAAHRAGFEGLELWQSKLASYLENHDVGDLASSLRLSGISPAAICPTDFRLFSETAQAFDKFKRWAKVAVAIGCPVLLVCADLPPEGMGREEAFRAGGRQAREYAKVAADHGLKVAIEPLGMNPFIPGPVEALDLIEASGGQSSMGLMLDTFHYHKSGVTLDEMRAIPVPRLLIVHINDVPALSREEMQDSDRVYPGLGAMPLKSVLGVMREIGYEGFVSVETFNRDYWKREADVIALEAKAALDRVMSDHGR